MNPKNIAIITIHTPEIECYSRYTLAIFQKYCLEHGYTLIIEKRNSIRAPSWDKVLVLNKYHKLFDYIFWFDADIVINDLGYKLENIIAKMSKSIGICEDGTKYREFNCGTIVIKNDEKVKPFLDKWWQLGEEWKLEHWLPWEQKVLNRWGFVANTNTYDDLIEKLPNNTMNNPLKEYPQDNFLHHMFQETLDIKTKMSKEKFMKL